MASETIEAIVAESAHFSVLSSESVRKIIAAAHTTVLARGQLLFSQNEESDGVYLVLTGEIAIEITSPDGRTVRVASLKKGDVFGELGVLDGGLRTADARALTAAQLLKIRRDLYRDLVSRNPDFALLIITELTKKLRATDNQVEDISLKPLKQRLAMILVELAEDGGVARSSVQITQTEIADRLSATREKVNVHLQAIQRAGAISISRGRITFIDLRKLKDLVDN